MKFRIWTILWVFALLASAMATLGVAGILLALAVIFIWALHFAHKKAKPWFSSLELFVAVGFIMFVLQLFPVARESVRRNSCANNMKQIGLAIHNYADRRKEVFPKSAQSAPNSDYLHSWRMWIYPGIESSDFYQKYRRDESWHGPSNTKLMSQYNFDLIFHCPSHHTEKQQSHYLAIVGDRTLWPPDRVRTWSEITDGSANTIMFIEASHKHVPWGKPVDLSFEEAVELLTNPPLEEQFGHEVHEGFFYKPTRGINVAFADGRVEFLALPLSKENAVALLTVDGGEEVDVDDLPRPQPALDYGKIYSLSVFMLLVFVPLIKPNRTQTTET